MCSYIYRRGAVYCTRMIVPSRLRPIIGKSDLGRSLRTKDQAEAKRLLPSWLEEAQSILAAAEAELARGIQVAVIAPHDLGGQPRFYPLEVLSAAPQVTAIA